MKKGAMEKGKLPVSYVSEDNRFLKETVEHTFYWSNLIYRFLPSKKLDINS